MEAATKANAAVFTTPGAAVKANAVFGPIDMDLKEPARAGHLACAHSACISRPDASPSLGELEDDPESAKPASPPKDAPDP